MGLLSAAMNPQVFPQAPGSQQPLAPQMPPQGQGMAGAWANNPQFQSYMQSLMQGQGPGMQMPQMMPPQTRMQTMPMTQSRGGAFGGGAGMLTPEMMRLMNMG